MIYLFLLAVNFALYIVKGSDFSFIPLYLTLAFCIILTLFQYRTCLRIYDRLKESAYKLAEKEKEKIAQFDTEDYVKWATMESYVLYEKKMQNEFYKKYGVLNNIITCGMLAVVVLVITIVVTHLIK